MVLADFAVGFLVAGFFAVSLSAFLVSAFGAAFFAATGAFLAVVFGAAAAGFSVFSFFVPAALAIFAKAALRREAVFLCKRFFLTALSYSDWTERRFSEVGLDLNSLKACLMDFLMD